MRQVPWVRFVFVAAVLLAPAAAQAQSAIAGQVRDATGASLAGVTVEASSPALIEQSRTVITDGAGQYKIVNLRPGSYTVAFTLSGFSALKREGLELVADFTATINAELKIGALEETITVSSQAPVVDVQSTVRREVMTRDLLDALPTGRSFVGVANVLAAVNIAIPDVAGSTSIRLQQVTAYGGLNGDQVLQLDGMAVMSMVGAGAAPGLTFNEQEFQDYVVQLNGGAAESPTGGVLINQIPKEGGNQFHGGGVGYFANSPMQSNNLTDDLRARGLLTRNSLFRTHDVGGNLGGPIQLNKLWFFSSVRNWNYQPYVANAFNPDGSQLVDDGLYQSYMTRLTHQVSAKNKITAAYDRLPKHRGHRDADMAGFLDPKATGVQPCQPCYYAQAKWTSPVSNKLLVDAGFTINYFDNPSYYQPDVTLASCFTLAAACPPGTSYGDIAKQDLILGTHYNSSPSIFDARHVRKLASSSLTYVTGSHAIKTGVQWNWGSMRVWTALNGEIVQRYRNGVPDSVEIRNTPVYEQDNLKADLGIYLQDSWTMKRLTLNPGVRWQYFLGEIPAQSAPAGRFVPARNFPAIEGIPDWKNWAPRMGAAYDLFGNGKTAIKGSVGKYLQMSGVDFQSLYNPMRCAGSGTQCTAVLADIRTWRDLNGDGLAEENEFGPTSNATFGVSRFRNPDPNIKRPYQVLYNLSLQQELRQGLALTVSYNRRRFHDLTQTTNLAAPVTAYTPVTIADPRGNGQTITIYNLLPVYLGSVNELDTTSSSNTQTFNGFDAILTMRRGGANITGGMSAGRVQSVTCDVGDPNALRFCDQTQYHVPFRTTFKLAGTYPLPYNLHVSGVFQSVAGAPFVINYLVNRGIVPTLTQAQVTVPLNNPGSAFNDRVNQLDLGFSRTFRMQQTRVTPEINIFNALNRNPVISQTNVFGPSLYRPNSILNGRLLRVGLRIDF